MGRPAGFPWRNHDVDSNNQVEPPDFPVIFSWDVGDQMPLKKKSPKIKRGLVGLFMDVSENSGTRKSSSLVGFSIINHPFWGTPIFGNTHITYRWWFHVVFVLWKWCKLTSYFWNGLKPPTRWRSIPFGPFPIFLDLVNVYAFYHKEKHLGEDFLDLFPSIFN